MTTIKDLKKELETQDNMHTDNPFFIVYRKRELPTSSDYSYDRCFYLEHVGDYIECGETEEEVIKYLKETYGEDKDNKIEELIKLQNTYSFNDKLDEYFTISKVYMFQVDVFVQGFFTRKGAEEYIRVNGHNLNKPYIYCNHLYRNDEMREIRKYFMETEIKEVTKNE